MVNCIKIYFLTLVFFTSGVVLPQNGPRSIEDDTRHLMEIIRAARISAGIINLDSINPAVAQNLRDTLAFIENNFSYLQKGRTYPDKAGIKTISRQNRNDFDFRISRLEYGQTQLSVALQYIKKVTNQIFSKELEKKVGKKRRIRILTPITLLYQIQLEASLYDGMERLRRYEIKYGPGSARLNFLETAVNYGLQGISLFGADPQKGPGPLEAVLSYSSTWLIAWDLETKKFPEQGMVLTMFEAGIRTYMFKNGWGEGNMLKPAYISAGVALAAPDDGPLRLPFADKGDIRPGLFLSWGSIKLAYVGGDNKRFLLSRQFQLIPFLF